MPVWICILIGLVIGFIVTSVMRSQLKTVRRASAAGNYLAEGSLSLTISTDRFLYENTTRTAKAKSNNK